ncbi:Dna[CI] antecedent, DciA family protein [Candidatus Erwinia haradaeae]|uniref:Dna[CI] antecedent, DciA family protein n=1 Tax=Candidatus Erwinia haradaeae TaxID=1922217 RepID=A0A451DK06_9GAMM|nr:DciA family protein [Candidatus Erwinia haradaeae]VFP87022.1 Dna[CI] antecedent, DciA family protein [Candidatus Erwinia haradaeae]
MRDHQPQLIQSFLEKAQKQSTLQCIYQRTTILNGIRLLIRQVIPESLYPWYNVANIHQGILILHAANANYLMYLHYEQTHLLNIIREQILPSLISIHIKIDPTITMRAEKIVQDNNPSACTLKTLKTPFRQLGEKSANILLHIAKDCPEKLKNTLERLALFSVNRDTLLSDNQ